MLVRWPRPFVSISETFRSRWWGRIVEAHLTNLAPGLYISSPHPPFIYSIICFVNFFYISMKNKFYLMPFTIHTTPKKRRSILVSLFYDRCVSCHDLNKCGACGHCVTYFLYETIEKFENWAQLLSCHLLSF